MATIDLITLGDIRLHHVDADPSGGGGLAADIGSTAYFDDGGAGKMFLKTGSGDTAWTEIFSGTIDLTSEVTGVLPVANGGTGLDASTVTAGQILIGNDTNNDFDLATLTAGSNITINNADGSITINATGPTVQDDTVSTTDATLTTLATYDLSTADENVFLDVCVLANVTGGAGGNAQRMATFERKVHAKNDGGVVTIILEEAEFTSKESAVSGFDVAFSVSGTDLLARVTGGAADNVNWSSSAGIKRLT